MSLTIWTDCIRSKFIFVFISNLRVRFLFKLNVNYPSSSKEFFLKKLQITHLLLVSYFMMFIMSPSTKVQSLLSLRILNKKIKHCEFVVPLQTNQVSTSLGCVSETRPQPKEPQISLIDKFDGTCSKFKSVVDRLHLAIRLHPHWYPNGPARVGPVGTLLSSMALVWFPPLLEH